MPPTAGFGEGSDVFVATDRVSGKTMDACVAHWHDSVPSLHAVFFLLQRRTWVHSADDDEAWSVVRNDQISGAYDAPPAETTSKRRHTHFAVLLLLLSS